MKLIYVMDPMCGWCYGFRPELEEFLKNHSELELEYVMGGLAPDTDIPMEKDLQKTIASYWYEIEKKTKVTFNHDFWELNTPYRSTFNSCRAVIAAESLKTNSSEQMVKSIQSAYYNEAKNPSLDEILIACAVSIGLDEKHFRDIFKSEETNQKLQEHFNMCKKLQVRGFPALFYLDDANEVHPLSLGYSSSASLEYQLTKAQL